MDRTDAGGSILWFLSGAAIGAVIALLYAPETGERTRRTLAKQARRGSEVLAEQGRGVYERGRDLYERGREIAEDAADMFERGRKMAEKKIDEAI